MTKIQVTTSRELVCCGNMKIIVNVKLINSSPLQPPRMQWLEFVLLLLYLVSSICIFCIFVVSHSGPVCIIYKSSNGIGIISLLYSQSTPAATLTLPTVTKMLLNSVGAQNTGVDCISLLKTVQLNHSHMRKDENLDTLPSLRSEEVPVWFGASLDRCVSLVVREDGVGVDLSEPPPSPNNLCLHWDELGNELGNATSEMDAWGVRMIGAGGWCALLQVDWMKQHSSS